MHYPRTFNRDQQLRVFFSADLCGGDDYKHRWPTEDFPPQDTWPARFEKFFTDFDRRARSDVATARERDDAAWLMPGPQLWKTDDDALLYMELVYPKHEIRHAALASAVKTFVSLVSEFDRDYLPRGSAYGVASGRLVSRSGTGRSEWSKGRSDASMISLELRASILNTVPHRLRPPLRSQTTSGGTSTSAYDSRTPWAQAA